jgi:stage VI sporulation protein D
MQFLLGGGVRLTQDHNVFTFDLNELLWFQKGQEVRELIGIALEPDISIYESDEYVSVRGVIELTGEYMPNQEGEEQDTDEQVVSFQDHYSKSYIQDVRSFDDGLNEFHYNIPVDITIPKYRVPSLDDVMIEIDYFDYEIPDPSQLKLQAEVLISGIQQERSEETDQIVETEESRNDWEEVSQPFSFEFKFEEDSEDEESSSSSEFVENTLSSETKTLEVKRDETEEVHEEEPEKERDLWFKKKSQSFSEFFGQKDKDNENPKGAEDQYNDDSPNYNDDSPDYNEEYGDISFDGESSSEVSSYEESRFEEARPKIGYHSDNRQDDADGHDGQDAVYLINMFDKEEDTYSRIRMCIVQESDTLESIAERYAMSKMQLVRYNNLEEETVNAGDILYIPRQKQKDPS